VPAQTMLKRSGRGVARRVCHAYPLMSGMGLIANTAPFRFLADGPDPDVVARLRGGGIMHARLDDFVGRSVFYFGDLDPKIRWVCKRVLRPGDVVIDVGANIGMITLAAARLVGPTGSVHAVEPQDDLAQRIRRSAALNRYGHVTVHSMALSNTTGTMTLTIPADNAGEASLEPGLVDGRRATVRVERTDEFLRSTGGGNVRLLKLDVEGHEAAVLEGAGSALAENGPDVILFEELGLPAGAQASVRLLRDAGYRVLAIPRAKVRLRLVPVSRAGDAHDFVALRSSAGGDDALGRLRI
jgi:FkbM family methyltransferase